MEHSPAIPMTRHATPRHTTRSRRQPATPLCITNFSHTIEPNRCQTSARSLWTFQTTDHKPHPTCNFRMVGNCGRSSGVRHTLEMPLDKMTVPKHKPNDAATCLLKIVIKVATMSTAAEAIGLREIQCRLGRSMHFCV